MDESGTPSETGGTHVTERATGPGAQRPWWRSRRAVLPGIAGLAIAAPLASGDGELIFLNLVGLGIGWLLLGRFTRRPPRMGRFRS